MQIRIDLSHYGFESLATATAGLAGSVDQVQEFVAGAGRGEECAGECGGRGDGVGFLYSSDLHAGMGGFDDDGNAERMERVLDAIADFDGESFLDLEASGVCFDDSGDFAEAGDLAVRDVGDVGLADEREHVVFAHGVEFDVFHEYHLLIFFIENR